MSLNGTFTYLIFRFILFNNCMVSFYLKIQNKFFFFLCLGSCQEQMAAFFEDNTMPAVAQVEADLKDYNYKYGSID